MAGNTTTSYICMSFTMCVLAYSAGVKEAGWKADQYPPPAYQIIADHKEGPVPPTQEALNRLMQACLQASHEAARAVWTWFLKAIVSRCTCCLRLLTGILDPTRTDVHCPCLSCKAASPLGVRATSRLFIA